MPKKTYHHGNLKTEILTTARSLLEEGGDSAISMRKLALAAKVTPMAAYNHFSNKDEILTELAKLGFRELETTAERARSRAGNSPDKQFEAIGVTYVMHGIKNPELYKLMFRARQEATANPELVETAEASYDVLRNCLREHASAFGFPLKDVERHAFSCWAMVHGVTSLFIEGHARIANHTPSKRRRAAHDAVRMMLNGIYDVGNNSTPKRLS